MCALYVRTSEFRPRTADFIGFYASVPARRAGPRWSAFFDEGASVQCRFVRACGQALLPGEQMEPMIGPLDHAGGSPRTPSSADIRAELARILDSPTLRVSNRRRALLQYLVDETLAGRGDRLKGVSVALAVFGREENFDPQSDPVVRFEARRLRSDLDSYYVDAGSRDPLRISIPKGGYVPRFDWQSGAGPDEAARRPEEATPPLASIDGQPLAAPVTGAGEEGTRRLRLWAALAAVVILVAAFGAWFRQERWSAEDEVRGPSVIVLPFSALSVGDNDRFLAEGMTQELIGKLSRFPEFRLFSAPASFAQSPGADARELGRTLGTGYVVQGNLRSEDSFVHVRAMLTDAATGEVLWNGTYDRPLSPTNMFAVQEEISAEISTTLGQPYGVLSGQEADRMTGAPSMSSYACVLRAYDYRRSFDEGEYRPVLGCLEAAVARDPDYSDAWAMLGWLQLDAGRFGMAPDGREQAYRRALESASRAAGIDPRNALAFKALGAIYHYSGRYTESVHATRTALEINPNDPDTMAQLGWRLAVRGNFKEGIPYLRRAIDRTVSPPGWYFHLIAVDDYLRGDYASDACRRGALGRRRLSDEPVLHSRRAGRARAQGGGAGSTGPAGGGVAAVHPRSRRGLSGASTRGRDRANFDRGTSHGRLGAPVGRSGACGAVDERGYCQATRCGKVVQVISNTCGWKRCIPVPIAPPNSRHNQFSARSRCRDLLLFSTVGDFYLPKFEVCVDGLSAGGDSAGLSWESVWRSEIATLAFCAKLARPSSPRTEAGACCRRFWRGRSWRALGRCLSSG